MRYTKDYAVIVVGAGHAGIEAGLVCARLGLPTLLLTLNLDTIGRMSCNPAIGGPGKSQLVRELDALGGEMGKAADATFLQLKMLNLSKGPAVHSLRAQSDRAEYVRYMKKCVENTPDLDVKQAEVSELILDGKTFKGVKTKMGFEYYAQAVVLTTGTFLRGEIFIGMESAPAGRLGEFPADALTASLNAHGILTGRLKTGTTPRIDRRTINFSKVQEEPGLEENHFFSFTTEGSVRPQQPCYLVRTNPESHKIILDNLDRSPLYQGMIKAVGPRYCPSIEDKVVRFADKDSHHLFLEPEGADTNEMYVQGFSTSLPYDVQLKVLRSISGLEKVEIMRPGYAIAYDFIFPEQLTRALKLREFEGIYSAGQINGTSGYEEAAIQGLVAGINAAQFVLQKEPLLLTREDSYAGTLIDDLITKEIREPYRMMTSRSEYRLFLRQDNAEDRLLAKGKKIGLISEARWEKYQSSKAKIEAEKQKLNELNILPNKKNTEFLLNLDEKLTKPSSAAELLRRQNISLLTLEALGYKPVLTSTEAEKLTIEIKYSAFLEEVEQQIRLAQDAEKRKIPPEMDYSAIIGLRREAREKLEKIKPETIGQAGRIAGVNPADISILLVWLKRLVNTKK
ncbi:tRNA uridine-5-carboxymethylaminomethyl(34) synthesis enzyme MnmG [Candidatus Termititenax dinenymphae]|uniref:tRNA uridine 5-carboxymethylaminomethyl modification enzyme MnmG n=1 Tax=Candidatus Termititenax dinenymphae TaxID=2218523 RepID=A0A388TJK4_9BACT|nr:tRNA uridine-5-carboxymethylaminomethyl(34) synthesis enzyme MnmG [Candidatus Termititenax dinenymphae]